METRLTDKHRLIRFRHYSLGNTPAKKARSLAPHASSSPNSQATPYRPLASMPSRLKSSPAASASSAAEGSMSSPPIKSPANTPFHARPAKLALQETLNKSLSLPTARQKSSEHSRITLASTMDPKAYTYRYMYERMMERSEMLDSTIDEAAEILKNHYGIDELGDPSIQSQVRSLHFLSSTQCWF
jgi:DNA polymerase alpha subunit B